MCCAVLYGTLSKYDSKGTQAQEVTVLGLDNREVQAARQQ